MTKGTLADKTRALIRAAVSVFEASRRFWPLTLRQVYYALVGRLVLENSLAAYRKLSRDLVKARDLDMVPWESMEDRSREFLVSGGWLHRERFVGDQLDDFLDGYRRDLLQTQEVRPEVWIEKDALSRICHGVAFPYCVPVIVARGWSSASFVHDAALRVRENAKMGQRTVILQFGDLDPSGWYMLPAVLDRLHDKEGLGGWVDGVRCALRPEQVIEYDLPTNPTAMKEKDPNTPKFKAMLRAEGYPDTLSVELDALPMATLEGLVVAAIEAQLDLSKYAAEQAAEAAERDALEDLRDRTRAFVEAAE